MKIGVVGAGITGLTAAYELTNKGHYVEVFEASERLGGLASGFRDEGWEWPLERFYHHWFASDRAVLELLRELGLGDKVFFPRPITSIWHKGEAYPFDSPWAVLKFPHLSWAGKVRFGIVGLYLRLSTRWQPLESYTAHDWLLRWMGQEAYTVLWEPLLAGKFGPDYKEVNMAWFWARLHKRSPRLGYMEGGFQTFADTLASKIKENGGIIHLKSPVKQIKREGNFLEVTSLAGVKKFDAVLATCSPKILASIVKGFPNDYIEYLSKLRSLGTVVLVVALRNPLTSGHYWINLPKGEFPFLALVEHTNYISPKYYGGDHIVYLGDYVPTTHEYFRLSKEKIEELFLPHLSRFNPSFKPDWIRKTWLFREPYTQPVPLVNYSRIMPSFETPILGLYWASMHHVYPWDRGTNYSVELGKKVAEKISEMVC